LWKRDFPTAFSLLLSFEGSPVHEILVVSFVNTLRSKVSGLISKSYSTIPVSKCAQMLGLNTEEALVFAHRYGWEYNESTNYFIPRNVESEKNTMMTADVMHKLTQYISFLEESVTFNKN
jgi:hypothetical protein